MVQLKAKKSSKSNPFAPQGPYAWERSSKPRQKESKATFIETAIKIVGLLGFIISLFNVTWLVLKDVDAKHLTHNDKLQKEKVQLMRIYSCTSRMGYDTSEIDLSYLKTRGDVYQALLDYNIASLRQDANQLSIELPVSVATTPVLLRSEEAGGLLGGALDSDLSDLYHPRVGRFGCFCYWIERILNLSRTEKRLILEFDPTAYGMPPKELSQAINRPLSQSLQQIHEATTKTELAPIESG